MAPSLAGHIDQRQEMRRDEVVDHPAVFRLGRDGRVA
jgi:hypothetical protein